MSATRIAQENGTRAGRNALPLAHLGHLGLSTPFGQRLQPTRQSTAKPHRCPRDRMDKLELARMERQPSGGIGSRPVFQIADNGMAQNRQLNADLVLAY